MSSGVNTLQMKAQSKTDQNAGAKIKPQVKSPSTSSALLANAKDLEAELAWLSRVIDARFKAYFGAEEGTTEGFEEVLISVPNLSTSDSPFAALVSQHHMDATERLCLILALAPHIRPQLLDVFFIKNKNSNRRFTEFGGVTETIEANFFPTGETLAFLLAGNDLSKRFQLIRLFTPDHFFSKTHLFDFSPATQEGSPLKIALRLSHENLLPLTNAEEARPHFSTQFPARRIETQLSWSDLLLPPEVLKNIEEIQHWINHGDTLLHDWNMAGKIRPGYRALFYGPPGTGKTMTACLLGKASGHDVYRVDLSSLISKYIGETEKNLSKVLDLAESKRWILFFDEADALFGRRSETKGAHDRYANQEVSYLLQRIELFNGIVILASNYKENIDKAFIRRFEGIIHFPMPDASLRKRLWENGFSKKAKLDPSIDLEAIAARFELSGGSILNIIRSVSLQALATGDGNITRELFQKGIKRELAKEGKIFKSY